MVEASSMQEVNNKYAINSSQNREGKRLHMGSRCRGVDNVRMNLMKTACQGLTRFVSLRVVLRTRH